MKKLSCLLGLAGLGWILYCLFQPMIDWNFGWKKMPEALYAQSFEGVYDSTYSEAISKSKAHLIEVHKKSDAPSVSIAVAIEGTIIWSHARGFANIEREIPADTSTRYRIGSVSKAITSLGLGTLLQTRSINLDSSIQHYTGKLLDKPRITVRQLASHQSGIRNYGVRLAFPIWEYYRSEEFSDVEESLAEFEQDELLFDPGERFAYSSYNITALSYAMEKASGTDYLIVMDEYVFRPLRMNNTLPDKNNDVIANKAIPYESDKEYFKEAFPVNLSNKWAGGGLLSTPSDLVLAGNALLDTIFLSKETIETLISPQVLNDGTINEQNYALGWRHHFSERYFEGRTKVEVIHHGGMAVGGLALLVVFPAYDVVVAMTMNKSGQQGNFELFDHLTPIVNSFLKDVQKK